MVKHFKKYKDIFQNAYCSVSEDFQIEMWEFEELVIAAVTMSRAAQQNQNPLLELIHLK